jgi:hypothetical protein
VPPGASVLFGAVPPFAVKEPKLEVPPLFVEVEVAPCVLIAAPPPPTAIEIDAPGETVKD